MGALPRIPPVHHLGVVPYLNAIPLLADLPREATLEAADPGALAERLAAGACDAALLPLAEALRGVGGGFLGRDRDRPPPGPRGSCSTPRAARASPS
jgi:hypothetical protein